MRWLSPDPGPSQPRHPRSSQRLRFHQTDGFLCPDSRSLLPATSKLVDSVLASLILPALDHAGLPSASASSGQRPGKIFTSKLSPMPGVPEQKKPPNGRFFFRQRGLDEPERRDKTRGRSV